MADTDRREIQYRFDQVPGYRVVGECFDDWNPEFYKAQVWDLDLETWIRVGDCWCYDTFGEAENAVREEIRKIDGGIL